MKIDVKIDEVILDALKSCDNPYQFDAFKDAMPSVVSLLKGSARLIKYAEKIVFVFIDADESRVNHFYDMYLNGTYISKEYFIAELGKFYSRERVCPMIIGVEPGIDVIPFIINSKEPEKLFDQFMDNALRTLLFYERTEERESMI